jgi:hypothetical protein
MSVQLIVYPQNYEGGYNEISSSPTEFIVNGINFHNLNSTATYQSNGIYPPYQDVLDNAPASTPNTWYRFRVDGVVAYPLEVSGNLVLDSIAGPNTLTGVYQRLTNLTIGAQYTITINLSVATTGFLVTQIADGNTIYAGTVHDPALTQSTSTFTANSTDSTIMFVFVNTGVATANISSISIQPVIGAVPSGATNVLENGQVICDLYEDEDIPLSLSVDDFKNVAEKVQSYSKAFNLPATKRNNRIFDNIFEITRSNDGVIFNPYKKTKCVLKQDGFILFEGYLRMLDVTDKEGETSYNVNLYSEVVAFADVLGDRAFRDLDFTELEHAYNKTQIKRSWRDAGGGTSIGYTNPDTSGFRDDYTTLRYPFVDWTHQIAVGGSNNNSATVGNPELLTLEAAFRPFINIKYLIDRIFEATPFTYESEFFDTDDFKKLFMDFNWGSNDFGTEVTGGSYGGGNGSATVLSNNSFTAFPLDSTDYDISMGWDSVNYRFVATYDSQAYVIQASTLALSFYNTTTLDTRWAQYNSSNVLINTYAVSSVNTPVGFLQISPATPLTTMILDTGDYLQYEWKTTVAGEGVLGDSQLIVIIGTTGDLLITTNTLLQTLRGELGQWDFLKGILTMFNLVTLPDEDNPNNIKIEPYSDVFIPTGTAGNTLADRGVEHDWTEKIDVSEMKLTPLTDLNKKTIFKFVEDDDDYSFNQYKNQVGGHLYGSKKFNAGDEFNILVGEDEIIAEPFAATLVKPLMSQFPDFITPALYSKGGDGVWEGFDNSPRIMYNNGIKSTGTTYYIPAQNGLSSEHQPDFLQFSHLSDVPTITGSLDFHFGECQLMTGVGSAVPDNLFNLYWLPYYSELYNPNTRIMTIKVNLSPADINTFKFNDTVYIKNRVFRVNKIDYKPNDLATVEFILIP